MDFAEHFTFASRDAAHRVERLRCLIGSGIQKVESCDAPGVAIGGDMVVPPGYFERFVESPIGSHADAGARGAQRLR